jgi:hypothetical protein
MFSRSTQEHIIGLAGRVFSAENGLQSTAVQLGRKESIAMDHMRFEFVVGGFAMLSIWFAPTLVSGQAGEDVILVGAAAPELDDYRPGRYGRGDSTRQILALVRDMDRDLKEFGASNDELAEQLLALEQESADGPSDEESESVQGNRAVPKPIYPKFPMDEQGDALRDASRTLFELAESLEKRGLRWRAESLRGLAEELRDDSRRQCKEQHIGLCSGPIVTLDDWGEEFNERWARLPEFLKPRKDSELDIMSRGMTKRQQALELQGFKDATPSP